MLNKPKNYKRIEQIMMFLFLLAAAGGMQTASATLPVNYSFTNSSYPHWHSINDSMNSSISWVKSAQDASPNDGRITVAYYTNTMSWSASKYNETTGYMIPTFFRLYHLYGDTTLRTRAMAMADGLVANKGSSPYWDKYVFDNGQILSGLTTAYDETGNTTYLNLAIEVGNWYNSTQNMNGSWTGSIVFGDQPHTYDAMVDWSLLKLYNSSGNISYKYTAQNNLNWILSNQQANGWLNNTGSTKSDNSSPISHLIAYVAEGLLESGYITNNQSYINGAKLIANQYLTMQNTTGSLTGCKYKSDWATNDTPTGSNCLTADAQMAIVWLRLYNSTGDIKYLNASRNTTNFLIDVQGKSLTNSGINGGIWGSFPYDGDYDQYELPNWAVKFFMDALYYQILYDNTTTTMSPSVSFDNYTIDSGSKTIRPVNIMADDFDDGNADWTQVGTAYSIVATHAQSLPYSLQIRTGTNTQAYRSIVNYTDSLNITVNFSYYHDGVNTSRGSTIAIYDMNGNVGARLTFTSDGYISSYNGAAFVPIVKYPSNGMVNVSWRINTLNNSQDVNIENTGWYNGYVTQGSITNLSSLRLQCNLCAVDGYFDSVTVTETDIIPGKINMKFSPYSLYIVPSITAFSSTDSFNVTISTWNTTGDYHKIFTVSSNTSVNPTTFIIGDFPSSTKIRTTVNGVTSDYTSDSTGYIQFNYNVGNSPIIFTVALLPFPTATQSGQTSGLLEAAVVFLAVVFILSIFPLPDDIRDYLNLVFVAVAILFIIAIFIAS